MNWIPLLAAVFLAAFIFSLKKTLEARAENRSTRYRILAFTTGALLLMLLSGVWIIAGSDPLFRRTVPLEQRLVSYNESIRRRAQQELLGLGSQDKQDVVNDLVLALRRDDPFVRKWSAISLALLGPAARDAIPALLQAVSDKESDVAQASRVALTEIGVPDPDQIPALLQALQDPRDAVRCEAASTMAKLGPAAAEVVPILIGYLQKPAAAPLCFETALAALAGSLPDRQTALVEMLGSGLRDVRLRAARVLAQAGNLPVTHVPGVLALVSQEQDAEIRSELARVLQMPAPGAAGPAETFSTALRRSARPEVRRAALAELRRLTPPPPQVEKLWSAALKDADLEIRLETARWVRQSAYESPQSVSLWLTMLRDSEAAVRQTALEALRSAPFRPAEAYAPVARAQKDSDPGVRCRAVEVLVEWGAVDRIAVPLVVSDLSKDEEVARWAVQALSLAGLFHRGVVPEMIRLLGQDNRDLRARACRVLMGLGQRAKDALPGLEKAQRDKIPGAAQAIKAIRASLPAATRPRRR